MTSRRITKPFSRTPTLATCQAVIQQGIRSETLMIIRTQVSHASKHFGRYFDASRNYARVVGGMINSPPPPAPSHQPSFNTVQVGQKTNRKDKESRSDVVQTIGELLAGKAVKTKKPDPFSFDISRPPADKLSGEFRTVKEPPKLRPDHDLYEYLTSQVINSTKIQDSPDLRHFLGDLNAKANVELPQVLKNGNAGSPALSLDEISQSIVTIAHILPPPANSKKNGEVILSSGFAILDGSLIATCTHPLHQVNALCRSYDANEQQANLSRARSVAITSNGTILPISDIASHLVMSDIVLFKISTATSLAPLKISPYPCPAGNPILVYNLNNMSLSASSTDQLKEPKASWSWTDSEITLYQDRAGREAATGSYDELNTLLFNTVPQPGSSGGPIIDRETKAVVGITRGSEISYAVRKERGFGTPAESLFNVFKLDGF